MQLIFVHPCCKTLLIEKLETSNRFENFSEKERPSNGPKKDGEITEKDG